MSFEKSARVFVDKLTNALLEDRIQNPIGQLDYQYEDGSHSGLSYLPNVDVLETEEDLEKAYEVLVKVDGNTLKFLQENNIFSLEEIILAKAYSEMSAELEYAEDGEIEAPIILLKEIIEESYVSGIDGLFTEDLETIGSKNQYLYNDKTNTFEGVFTDGDKIFSFELVDSTGKDDWELSYVDVTSEYDD